MKKLIIFLFGIFLLGNVFGFYESDIEAEGKIIEIHNGVREYFGLTTLEYNYYLAQKARERCSYIKETNIFEHYFADGSSFSSILNRQFYDYRGIGENLSKGYSSIHDAMLGLWRSKSHRKNWMQPFWKDIGVGVNGNHICILFGTER